MTVELTGSHRATYDRIFHHPVVHNLKWTDVRSLFGAMADLVDQDDGNLRVSRNGETVVLRPPRDGDATPLEELRKIREFIGRSSAAPAPVAAPPATPHAAAAPVGGTHLLVVISPREARIYENERHGNVPQRLAPFDPDGSGKHLHRMAGAAQGRRKPVGHGGFYEAVARALRGAEQVLLFGHGTEAVGTMDWLLAELKQHHPGLAHRVIGSVVVDEGQLEDGQLLTRAREFYAALPAAPSPLNRRPE